MTNNEEFEKWAYPAYSLEKRKDGNYKSNETRVACAGYQARQPEIDALTEEVALCHGTLDSRTRNIETLMKENAALQAEVDRLRKDAERYHALRTPEISDFVVATESEALHQRERWGNEHDAGKTDADWFWLIGYLAGKAIRPDATPDKQMHHIITTAAACLNWHAHKLGVFTNMRPGIEEPKCQ